MLITDHADLMPGACFVTGRAEGPFLDTGYDIDDLANVGRVYLSVSFLSDAIDQIGGLGPDAAAALRDRIAELTIENERQASAIEGLTDANLALVKAGYSPAATIPNTNSASLEPPPARDPRYSAMSDDELLDAVLARPDLDVAPDASRDQIIEALGAEA